MSFHQYQKADICLILLTDFINLRSMCVWYANFRSSGFVAGGLCKSNLTNRTLAHPQSTCIPLSLGLFNLSFCCWNGRSSKGQFNMAISSNRTGILCVSANTDSDINTTTRKRKYPAFTLWDSVGVTKLPLLLIVHLLIRSAEHTEPAFIHHIPWH